MKATARARREPSTARPQSTDAPQRRSTAAVLAPPAYGIAALDGRRRGAASALHSETGEAPVVQARARVGRPGDRFEREADATADRVVAGRSASAISLLAPADLPTLSSRSPTPSPVSAEAPIGQRAEEVDDRRRGRPHRARARPFAAGSQSPPWTTLHAMGVGGAPLSSHVRRVMESHFGASFSGVRVHTGATAAAMTASLGARAFTHGRHLYFAPGEYRPETREGRHLLAHELTHTVQQGATAQTGAAPSPPAVSSLGVQAAIQAAWYDSIEAGARWIASTSGDVAEWAGAQVDDAQAWVAGQLEALRLQLLDRLTRVPGYRALTVVLATDPISGEPVQRSGRNLIEAGLDIIPGGRLLRDELQAQGVLQRAAQWLDGELATLEGISAQAIRDDLASLWNDLDVSDVTNIAGVLGRALAVFAEPLQRIVGFAARVGAKLLEIVKDALLSELVDFIEQRTKAYPLLTVLLGEDPITGEEVLRSGENLIRGFLSLTESGEAYLRQLEDQGKLQEAAAWIDGAVGLLVDAASELSRAFTTVWAAVTDVTTLLDPTGTFQEIYAAFAPPARLITEFVVTVSTTLLKMIKDALLDGLSSFARKTDGFALLTVILGQDPFTGEPVERSPKNIIRGFMLLREGGEQRFDELDQTGAIDRAVGWIEGAVDGLGLTWEYVTGLFRGTWESLSVQDLAEPLAAFARIMGYLAEPVLRLLGFVVEVVGEVVMLVMEIMGFPVDLIRQIVARTAAAIELVVADPVGFLLNMLGAVKQGFSQFFGAIGTHLLDGLKAWLFSTLEEAGITPPADLSLGSILGLVMDVLGISVDRILERVGKRIGPERVEQIRAAIDLAGEAWGFITDIVEGGPAALWARIEDQLGNLWDTVLEMISAWVMERVVDAMVGRLLSMLDPTGIMAVVNSWIALYRAIESFIAHLREMLEVVNSFVGGVLEIASGALGPAADYLETALAEALPIAIGFLANQVGLSRLGEKIGEMVEAIRERIDRALDWLIDRAVSTLGRLFGGEAASAGEAGPAGSTVEVDSEGGQHFTLSHGLDGVFIRGSPRKQYASYIEELEGHFLATATASDGVSVHQHLDEAIELGQKADSAGTEKEALSWLRKMAKRHLQKLPRTGQSGDVLPTRIDWDELRGEYGTGVKAAVLSPKSNGYKGSPVHGEPPSTWKYLSRRKKGNRTYYAQGHLLNANVYGPGDDKKNLTPIDQHPANSTHLYKVEQFVKAAVLDAGAMVRYRVKVKYEQGESPAFRNWKKQHPRSTIVAGSKEDVADKVMEAESHLATEMVCEVQELEKDPKDPTKPREKKGGMHLSARVPVTVPDEVFEPK